MMPRCERIELSVGTGETSAWVLLAALAAGCCATQPQGEGAPSARRAGRAERAEPGAAQVEFIALTGDEAAARLWPEPGPGAYAAPEPAQSEALAELVRRMLAEPPA